MRVVFICLWYFLSDANAQKERVTSDLRKNLLDHYDKNSRPINNDNETTKVELSYEPKHIFKLDEESETLKIEGFVRMTWTDEKLVWDPKAHGNVTSIRVHSQKIWQPDIFLLYGPGQNNLDQGRDTAARVTSQGRVTFYFPTSYEVPCVTNYRHYPLDKHSCFLEFASWTHDGDSIFLNVSDNFSLDKDSVIGAEWKMVNYDYKAVVLFQSNDKYPFNIIAFTMDIERTSRMADWVTVAPVLASALLATSGFWLELWSIPRYALGMANYVMISVHLLSLARSLPAGREIPLLAEFSATTLVMAVVFLLETVLLASTNRRRDEPPEILLTLARNVPDKILGDLPFQREPEPNPETEPREPEVTKGNDEPKPEWKFVSVVFDRLFFYLFTLVYVIVISCLFAI